MSTFQPSDLEILHPSPEHFEEIQTLCRKVYPFSKPWSIAQLETHQSYFPDGQLIAIDRRTNKVVGLAFSLIIAWDDYSPQDNWGDFTSSGYFFNHDPKKGKTLYGAEVMVDPEYRGAGVGKRLYLARQDIARKYKLKRIRAGARLRGYSKFQDRYSPGQYVKEVVEKRLYDPTLSFQLGQGFVALDVAKNYLFNDPESLGYAAVIEWLNPEFASERDYKRQSASVIAFMNGQRFVAEHLPRELRRLVRYTTLLLGKIIREYEGDAFYDSIENFRQLLKKTRNAPDEKILHQISEKLQKLTDDQRHKVAHGFALLLELINVCESAYRTWRQRQKVVYTPVFSRTDLVFVLTAHPTEARSKEAVQILQKLTTLMVDGLHNNFTYSENEVGSLLRMLWNYPLVKTRAPSVSDEADYIFSQVFSNDLFDFILSPKNNFDLKLRTWVGGDKDGHPGVNAVVMRECLRRSRVRLLIPIKAKLESIKQDLIIMKRVGGRSDTPIERINRMLGKLSQLEEFTNNDGKVVATFYTQFQALKESKDPFLNQHHDLLLLERLFYLFPALVLPLELREGASEINSALQNDRAPLLNMLEELKKIAGVGQVTSYARGLIISNCETVEDLKSAEKLILKAFRAPLLPVIPLFESQESLKASGQILTSWFSNSDSLESLQQRHNGKVEVMLGYSDSAKQIGMLASRHLIRSAMFDMEKTTKRFKLIPIFFHGSGGSVARGGGSIKEQISWWPDAAIQRPKLTIQGEMIQRTFATPEILNSQCLHMSKEARLRRGKKSKVSKNLALEKLVQFTEAEYLRFVQDPSTLGPSLDATPYHYLKSLKIGSRPSKRPSATISVQNLRAIPWVLCWTQTRLLMPTWWGIGTAWASLSKQEQTELIDLYKNDPFFSSYVKAVGFTLAKVEIGIWAQYLRHRNPKNAESILQPFRRELKRSMDFVEAVTEEKQLMAHKPWLEESIRLRSPYIHILNLLQIQAMQSGNEALLRETLVGIACGMLTTG